MIAVIWHHVAGYTTTPILSEGYRGVDMFFAISGFLITTLLLRERDRHGRISLRSFYFRRLLRIFPIYYVVLGVYCVLVALTLKGTEKGHEFWQNLPAFLTYTSNWFVEDDGTGTTFYFAWSLATEEQFYLFWPPLLLVILWATKRAWPATLAAVLLVGVQIAASASTSEALVVTILASLAPAILFGAAAAILVHQRRVFQVAYTVLGHPAAAPLLAVATLAVVFAQLPTLVIHATMALFVVSVCLREDTVLHPLLRLRPLAFLGAISYGMYLMHMLAANVVRRVLGSDFGLDVFFATTAVVVVAAYLSFRYFESPIQERGKRLRQAPPAASGFVSDGAELSPGTRPTSSS